MNIEVMSVDFVSLCSSLHRITYSGIYIWQYFCALFKMNITYNIKNLKVYVNQYWKLTDEDSCIIECSTV